MGHTAFNEISVIEKLSHKIEAIESWGNNLLVGTAEGALFLYEPREKGSGGGLSHSLSVKHVMKPVFKKPIIQLSVIEKFNVLLSLSDGCISVHELPSLALRNQITKTRGCHYYALDKSKPAPTLCVAIKRKLLLLEWGNGGFTEIKELVVPDSPKVIVWCGDNLCVGYRRAYNMINIHTGAISELFPSGKSANPIITLLPDEHILVLRETIGVFLDFNGKPIRKYGISWSEAPTEVAYSYPYAVAVLSKGVEVRSLKEGSPVQTLALRTAPRFIIAKNDDIFVAASNQVWRLLPVAVGKQVDQLIEDRAFEEALSLCDCIPDSDPGKTAKVKRIRTLYSYNLFSQGHFGRSLGQFSELEFNPLEIIALYQRFLPKKLQGKFQPPPEIKTPISLSALEGPKLHLALPALINYLLQSRVKPETHSLPDSQDPDYDSVTDLATIVDTTLVKGYVEMKNDRDLNNLLEQPNACHVKQCEVILKDAGRYSQLVLLYKGKGLHRSALDLLTKLGKSQSDSTRSLSGPLALIEYLKQLGKEHLDLIFEFSEWPLKTSPDEGVMIFRHPRPTESALPAGQVLDFIQSRAPGKKEAFLEHVIHYQGNTSPEFHNQLIFGFLDRIVKLKKDDNYKGLRVPAGQEPGLLGTLRKKLLMFLEESQYYNPEKMLSRFPFEDLFEERAILLSRIGQHDKALAIYAHRLQDFKMAESYCDRHYKSEKEDARDVYLALIQVYLQPPQGPPMIEPALSLVQRHYTKINIPKALALLPAEVPISELFETFQSVLRINSEQRRTNQVVKNLLRAENLQVREQLIMTRSKVIKISEDRSCPMCNKRIGLSAFAYYPNGMVVHYHCRDRMNTEAFQANGV